MNTNPHQGTGTWLCAAMGRHAATGQRLWWHAPVAGWTADRHPLVYNDRELCDATDLGVRFVLYELVCDALPQEVRRSAQSGLAAILDRDTP